MQLPLFATSLILVWHAALSRSAVLRTHTARANTCTPADLCPEFQIGLDGLRGVPLDPKASRFEWFDENIPSVYCVHSDGTECVYTYLPTENNDGYNISLNEHFSTKERTWCTEKRTVKTNCKMPGGTLVFPEPVAADVPPLGECDELPDEDSHEGQFGGDDDPWDPNQRLPAGVYTQRKVKCSQKCKCTIS